MISVPITCYYLKKSVQSYIILNEMHAFVNIFSRFIAFRLVSIGYSCYLCGVNL